MPTFDNDLLSLCYSEMQALQTSAIQVISNYNYVCKYVYDYVCVTVCSLSHKRMQID